MENSNTQPSPRNIFEMINLNIVDLSKDFVAIAKKIEQIHAALYPQQSPADGESEQPVAADI